MWGCVRVCETDRERRGRGEGVGVRIVERDLNSYCIPIFISYASCLC